MIKGIEGIGHVSEYIFFDIAQGVWPNDAAFINPRSFNPPSNAASVATSTTCGRRPGKTPSRSASLARH